MTAEITAPVAIKRDFFKGTGFLKAQGYAPMTVFVWLWGWATLFHVFYDLPMMVQNAGRFYTGTEYIFALLVLSPVAFYELVFALVLIFRPRLYDLFLVMLAAMAVRTWLSFPLQSNHAFMEFVFSGAAALIFVTAFLRLSRKGAAGWADFYALFAPVGRWILLIMYFYGIFHKINTDFLNPVSSCAVALWKMSPLLPDFILNGTVFHYLAIYGTFVIEGICIALLMGPVRFKHWGILLGVAFHGFLGVNGYMYYSSFSVMCVALHALFLPPFFARRIAAIPRRFLRGLKVWEKILALAVTGGVLVLALDTYIANRHEYLVQKCIFLIFVLVMMWAIYLASKRASLSNRSVLSSLVPRHPVAAVVAIAFFINGFLPYTGLKTGQAVAMFSNLRTDRGETNHLIVPDAWLGMFGFQDKTIKILKAENDRELMSLAGGDVGFTDYAFRAWLRRNPEASVTFIDGDGKKVHLERAGDHPEWSRPEPLWAYRLMVFRFVHDARPVKCGRD